MRTSEVYDAGIHEGIFMRPIPKNVRVLNQISTLSAIPTLAIRKQSEMWIAKRERNSFHCEHEIFLEHSKTRIFTVNSRFIAVYPFCQQKRLFLHLALILQYVRVLFTQPLDESMRELFDISAAACQRRRKQTVDVRTSCWCTCHIKFVINFVPIAHYRCFIWCAEFLHHGYHDDMLNSSLEFCECRVCKKLAIRLKLQQIPLKLISRRAFAPPKSEFSQSWSNEMEISFSSG